MVAGRAEPAANRSKPSHILPRVTLLASHFSRQFSCHNACVTILASILVSQRPRHNSRVSSRVTILASTPVSQFSRQLPCHNFRVKFRVNFRVTILASTPVSQLPCHNFRVTSCINSRVNFRVDFRVTSRITTPALQLPYYNFRVNSRVIISASTPEEILTAPDPSVLPVFLSEKDKMSASALGYILKSRRLRFIVEISRFENESKVWHRICERTVNCIGAIT